MLIDTLVDDEGDTVDPVAKAAIIEATGFCWMVVVEFGPAAVPSGVLDPFFEFAVRVVGGFQYRNAVHTLQGFPSGPIIIPGGIPAGGLDRDFESMFSAAISQY